MAKHVTTETSAAPVTLRPVTRENIRSVLDLRVSDEQRKIYPRSNAYSIAEGHYPQDDDPVWMRAIYSGETPVGFMMTSEVPEQGVYFLWRLMIDANHQAKGYGAAALRLLIQRIEASGNGRYLLTSHLVGNGDAGPLYLRHGFQYTGETINGNERLMRKDFREADDDA